MDDLKSDEEVKFDCVFDGMHSKEEMNEKETLKEEEKHKVEEDDKNNIISNRSDKCIQVCEDDGDDFEFWYYIVKEFFRHVEDASQAFM